MTFDTLLRTSGQPSAPAAAPAAITKIQ